MITEVMGWFFGGALVGGIIFFAAQYVSSNKYEAAVKRHLAYNKCPAYNRAIAIDFWKEGSEPMDAARAIETWWERAK